MAQNEIVTRKLRINRANPDGTNSPETINVMPFLNKIRMLEYNLDATAGTVTTAFELPENAYLWKAWLNITDAFTTETSSNTMYIGSAGTSNGITTLTSTQSVGVSELAGSLVGTFEGGAYDITVDGAYTAGAAILSVLYVDPRQTEGLTQVGADSGTRLATLGY